MEISANLKQIALLKLRSIDFGYLNKHILQPIRNGLMGFVVIFMIIFFIRMILYITGITKILSIDILDLALALMGFLLQFFESLIKSRNSESKNRLALTNQQN